MSSQTKRTNDETNLNRKQSIIACHGRKVNFEKINFEKVNFEQSAQRSTEQM